ncbi:MAG: hypothetical protein ACREVZ_12885, partial [Burkholderiales bacterium]
AGPLETVTVGESREASPGPAANNGGASAGLGSDSPVSLEQTPAFEAWLKRRMVAMVAAGDEPQAIVDFLDVSKPGFANDLVAFPAEQVTVFLGADPILGEMVKHPRWAAVLEGARRYILEANAGAVAISTPVEN